MSTKDRLSIWGGVECTLNRVGENFFDQLHLSGHATRLDDLDRFAELGIETLRYPMLWERTSPDGAVEDWAWSDERMQRLTELAVEPIVGLVHHGSGPRGTSLLDPSFPEKCARYAGLVAERYPASSLYTPVNEPLTTARFSGLYGHWYPHERSDRAFVRCLLNECRAIALSMRAIRRVNSSARLVQTEDVGLTRSTPQLRYQADFENERRFLSFDLLTGRVGAAHPLRSYLLRSGATDADLGWFTDNPCPPDVLGINYYVTSERFLDSRTELYPAHLVGGNARHGYADVEAVRVCADGLAGPGAILETVWKRYGLPMAITEAHLGGAPDEQVKWLLYVVAQAAAARRRGVDVRAVTVWALVGSHGWADLVRGPPFAYEPGVFDVREGELVDTSLTEVVAALCVGAKPRLAFRDARGWWERPERLVYEPSVQSAPPSRLRTGGIAR
jgi:dTDP-4-dehydrorhamnose reductase